jgi:tetratricopeptide (TPR) repeat protein
VHGSFHSEQSGHALLALSSFGESWRVLEPKQTPSPQDAATVLADRLAFEIISRDPGLSKVGMTRSWFAFEEFRRGLLKWKEYEAGMFDSLTEAIEHFRKAVHRDAGFALAHYRLGLALRADGQPARGVEALRGALQAQADFVPGHTALAFTLAYFENYYYLAPAALQPRDRPSEATSQARSREARNLWQQVLLFSPSLVSLHDRASAYYGLCESALDAREYSLAYFYCKRAEQAYGKLPADLRKAVQVQQTQAAVLNTIGIALMRRKMTEVVNPEAKWSCSPGAVESLKYGPEGLAVRYKQWETPYRKAALRYFQRALALVPDDSIIQCNAALNSLLLGDSRPMDALNLQAATHRTLGDSFRQNAKGLSWDASAPNYFHLAIQEFERAIALDPADVDSLNGYAYTFWQWRYNFPSEQSPKGPGPAIAHQAEQHARQAVRLAEGKASLATEVMVRSTLGEVLLAQARPHEAIEVLETARATLPKHALFDEIRWDLAQAYLCAKENDVRLSRLDEHVRLFRNQAIPLLGQIEESERKREVQPFSNQPQRLDPARYQLVCLWASAEKTVEQAPASNEPEFRLRRGTPEYNSHPPCSWLGVLAHAFDENGVPVKNLMLHVWGGGIERRIKAGEFPEYGLQNVLLTSKPRATHHYYFAQLEDDRRNPLSPVYPIETFNNEAADRCSRNEISLMFVRHPAPRQVPGSP